MINNSEKADRLSFYGLVVGLADGSQAFTEILSSTRSMFTKRC